MTPRTRLETHTLATDLLEEVGGDLRTVVKSVLDRSGIDDRGTAEIIEAVCRAARRQNR